MLAIRGLTRALIHTPVTIIFGRIVVVRVFLLVDVEPLTRFTRQIHICPTVQCPRTDPRAGNLPRG